MPDNPAASPRPAGQPPAATPEADLNRPPPAAPAPTAEVGGERGPDPTRYGDWERGGRCIDF